MSKQNILIAVLILLVVTALAFGFWYYQQDDIADPSNPEGIDLFVELRSNIGPWDGANGGDDIWNKIVHHHGLVSGEDNDKIQKRVDSALAWFKGNNLKAGGWHYEAFVKNEVDAFHNSNPDAVHQRIAVGQFVS